MEQLGRVSLRDQDGKAMNDDGSEAKLLKVLAGIAPEDILRVLKEAGLEPGTAAYQKALESFGGVWAEKDPHALADWLLAANPPSFGSNIVSLAGHDPELALDVMQRAQRGSERTKGAEYGVVFSKISEGDPKNSTRLFEVTKFESEESKFDAMLGVLGGINRETVTPERMAAILAGFSEENLNAFPKATGRVGGILVDAFPVDQVLAQFPLDGAPWQRQVMISYLETAAYRGHRGDVEVGEFIQSDQGKLLTEEERGRLLAILGKK